MFPHIEKKLKSSATKVPYNLDDIPDLLNSLSSPTLDRKASLKAAKGLYELCDVDHKANRLVMAKNENVVNVICKAIRGQGNNDIRHLCLLVLNNLSIPQEAKEVSNDWFVVCACVRAGVVNQRGSSLLYFCTNTKSTSSITLLK